MKITTRIMPPPVWLWWLLLLRIGYPVEAAFCAVPLVSTTTTTSPQRTCNVQPNPFWGHGRPCSLGVTALKSSIDSSDDHEDASAPGALNMTIDPESIVLAPFPAAADPAYSCRGPVGLHDFIVSRTGEPTTAELSNENILRIVRIECSDLEVNTLVWKCLGYRFDETTQHWQNDLVFPNWKQKYPEPPDLIGMRRIYEPEIDQPVRKANQALVRSVPVHAKQSLKTHLKPVGFRGYKYAELTPNKTRRAQCANWLLYYREELFGYSLGELQERKRNRLQQDNNSGEKGEWEPPVKEVF